MINKLSALFVLFIFYSSSMLADTFADNFDTQSYSNQDGNVNWSSDWIETNDDNDPVSPSGDINITGGELHLQDNDVSIQRQADLSPYTAVTLGFDYREVSMNNANEWVDLEIRTGGNGSWTFLQRFSGPTNDSGSVSINITAYIASDTEIRFITSADMGNGDDFYIDNLVITATPDVGSGSPPTLIADYRFDELSWDGTTDEVEDSTSNGFDGTSFNASTTTGLICNAADLTANGTTDYISLDNQAMNGLGDFTISVWGQTSNSDTWHTILSGAAGNTGLLANEFVMLFDGVTAFQPVISEEFFSGSPSVSITSINDGNWHHFVWTRNASNLESCFYIDGVLQACVNQPDADDNDNLSISSGGLIVGQDQDTVGGSFESNQDWEGLLDELMIFDEVLTLAEVQSIRTNQLAGNNWDGSTRTCPSLPTPQVEYRFEEASWNGTSGEVIDESTNNLDGTAFNGANTANSNPAIAGDPGTCRYGVFDGVEDYVEVPAGLQDLSGSFTITAWINAADLNSGSRIVIDDANNNGGFGFSLGDGGAGRLRFFSRSVSPVIVDTQSAVITTNTWYFVAAVHDAVNQTRSIYVDGVPVTITGGGTTHTYTGTWGTDTGPISIGGEINSATETGAAFHFNGLMDEVRIYPSALSTTEIANAMAETHTCPAVIATNLLYLTTETDATLGGLSFGDEDIIAYDALNDSSTLIFDGSNILSSNSDIDAIHILDTGNILLSTNDSRSIGGTSFEDEDIVEYNPSTGVANIFLEGDTIFSSDEDIDAFSILPNGNYLISTINDATIGSTSFTDEDVVEYNPSSGAASLYFDESAVTADITDVRGVHALDNGNVLLTFTSDDRSLGGLTDIDEEDVIEYNLSTDTATLYFDGSLFSGSEDVRGVSLVESTASSIDHFDIDHNGTAIACLATSITVIAEDSGNNTVTSYTGSITISTDSGDGNWSLVTGAGSFDNGTADDGVATYTYDSSDNGEVTFSLDYSDSNSTSASVDIDVTDGSATDDETEGPLVFSPSGFTISGAALDDSVDPIVITDLANQTAGTAFDIFIAAYGQTDTDQNCGIIESYQGSQNLTFSVTYTDPSTGTIEPTINGNVITSPIAITFTEGQAQVSADYKDVGQIQIGAADGSITGDSNNFVVVPASFDIQLTGNPGATTASGGVFAAAGVDFPVTVVVRDADGDITPNYGNEDSNEGIALTHALVAPVGGRTGTLTGSLSPTVAANDAEFTGNYNWDDVGIITLTAGVGDGSYLGAGNVTTDLTPVGRFTPSHFALSGGAITAANTGFTYMGQNFLASYTLTTQALGGSATENYESDFAKLDVLDFSNSLADVGATADVAYGAVDATPTSFNSRLLGSGQSAIWVNGVAMIVDLPLVIGRSASLDGPFSGIDIGIAVEDSDSITFSALNLDSDTVGGDDTVRIGTLAGDLLYGRTYIAPVYGPEINADDPTPVVFEIQFYDGSSFVVNTADNESEYGDTTTMDSASVSNHTGNLSSSEFVVGDVNFPVTAITVINGEGDVITVDRPGLNNDGSVDVTFDVESWLQYNWNGSGDENPTTTIHFGTYRGHDRIIYWREVQ